MSELPLPRPPLRLADDQDAPSSPPADADALDREILRDLAAGNFARFDILVNRHKTRIFRFLYLRLGNLHVAEDLTQEVFLKVVRASSDPASPCRASTWLFTIARNCLTDHLRSQLRRARLHDTLLRLTPRDSALDPVTAAAFQEERTRVAAWFNHLPEEQREVLSLRFFADRTLPEIAAITGDTLPAVKSRLRYGLAKIASLLPKETHP
jgi:RNA polymerase sigma factor (sigma-70 family)